MGQVLEAEELASNQVEVVGHGALVESLEDVGEVVGCAGDHVLEAFKLCLGLALKDIGGHFFEDEKAVAEDLRDGLVGYVVEDERGEEAVALDGGLEDDEWVVEPGG